MCRLWIRKIAWEHDDNIDENAMDKPDLATMQFEELWLLHEELTKILSDKILAENARWRTVWRS